MRCSSAFAWLLLAGFATVTATGALSSTPPYPTPPDLFLRVGFGGTVTEVKAQGGTLASPLPSGVAFECPAPKGGVVVIPPVVDANNAPFCITASTQGLTLAFTVSLPYVTPKSLSCTELHGNAATSPNDSVGLEVRAGYGKPFPNQYDGARAKCNVNRGFAYDLAVETQGVGTNPGAAGGLARGGQSTMRTLLVPWSLLHLTPRVNALLINLDICGNAGKCSTDLAQFVVRVVVADGSYSVSAANGPYVRLTTPTPKPGATPYRTHELGIDATANWDVFDIASLAYSQDESFVTSQRTLSQAMSLAPVSLPMSPPSLSMSQTLQVRSQSFFAFALPSDVLEDPSLKSLFDAVPFSISKVPSLASGYSYGFTSQQVNAGAFYGLQASRFYSGAATVAVALATPTPTPNPSPTPTPFSLIPVAAAPSLAPLQPPPPPEPVFESGTQSVPPLQAVLTSGYSNNGGARVSTTGIAFAAHTYLTQTASADTYVGETFNLYARIQHNYTAPNPINDSSVAQFFGESATFTTASTNTRPSFFQVRETIGWQENESFFSPSIGSTTWLTPLSGPAAHVTISTAAGSLARYIALDLIGYRLTNVSGDIATQEGWQVSVPLPNAFDTPGWLLAGGTLTETASDRMAALQQGVVPSYATAMAEIPSTAIRPERLGNVSLLSPWLGKDLQLAFVAAYDSGTVTGCGQVPAVKPTKYACSSNIDNRAVGGLFVRNGPTGKFGVGATDTPTMQGNIASNAAAQNLGTNGALPGAVTSFITYNGGCPNASAAYTNAAFPAGVPFPQQGTTLSSQLEYPIVFGAFQAALTVGYFNEHATSGVLNESGAFGIVRISTAFSRASSPCK
jgi:hypothetical protein